MGMISDILFMIIMLFFYVTYSYVIEYDYDMILCRSYFEGAYFEDTDIWRDD